jgi:hypothetical protein
VGPAALLDACVLYPVGLRDTLLSVAQAAAFRPLWFAQIIAETRSARHGRPRPVPSTVRPLVAFTLPN